MAYITFADVSNELTDMGGLIPEGKEAIAWVNNKIASADLEIDARLSAKYVTPVTSATALRIVKVISLNLTCYYILRQNYTQEDGNLSDWVNEYKRVANDLLSQIISGDIDLTGNTNAASMAMSTTSGIARKLTSDTYDTDGNLISEGTMGDYLG